MPRKEFVCEAVIDGVRKTVRISAARQDEFYAAVKCPRCGNSLAVRTMSAFNFETICLECSAREERAKAKLRELKLSLAEYEGCGFIPVEVEDIVMGKEVRQRKDRK